MSWIGCVDTLSDTSISGWAADSADLNRTAQVDVIVNQSLVATLSCAGFRPDLLAAGIGDGRKSFHFDPSACLKPGGNTLEVRYAGTDLLLPEGRGHWVRRREGRISEWGAGLLAALEAYHQFSPDDCIGVMGAPDFERVLREAGVPFRELIHTDMLRDQADMAISFEKCDVVAAGFVETPETVDRVRTLFPEARLESISSVERSAPRLFAIIQAGTRAPDAGPVLAHIHVPKCAGTSFRALLERYFGPKHLGLYIDDTYFVFGDETIRSYLLQGREVRAFSSHHVRRFPRWLAGREMLYVTFLRDPVEQFVSYMTHIQKHFARLTAQTLLEAVPPDAPRLTLREFARWLLTDGREIPFRENHNVNFFSRHNAPRAADRLEAAKAALEKFFFVGIVERMDESLSKLRTLAQTAGLDFPPGPIPFENTSADYRDDLSWINRSDEVGTLLLHSVEKDRQLYDWAAARLKA